MEVTEPLEYYTMNVEQEKQTNPTSSSFSVWNFSLFILMAIFSFSSSSWCNLPLGGREEEKKKKKTVLVSHKCKLMKPNGLINVYFYYIYTSLWVFYNKSALTLKIMLLILFI